MRLLKFALIGGKHSLSLCQIVLIGDLEPERIPGHRHDGATFESFDERRAVCRRRPIACQRVNEHTPRKSLWRLGCCELTARQCLGDATLRIKALDGIDDRRDRDCAVCAVAQRLNHAIDHDRRLERARGVVNQYKRCGFWHTLESRCDRVGTRRTTRHRGRSLDGAEIIGKQRRLLFPALWHNDNDAVDQVVLFECCKRSRKNCAITEAHERLGSIGAEPLTRSGRDDDRPDRLNLQGA